MGLSINQILTPVTPAQARASLVAILVSGGIPADKWTPGGVGSSFLTASAAIYSLATIQITNIIAYFFLPIATGFGLQLLAQYVYGVTVPQATFASGVEVLTNSGGAIYTVLANQFSIQNPTTGQTFTNPSGFTIPATSSVSVPFQCVQAGSIGNSNPGDISNILTPLLGVTATNPSSFVGIDQPSDATIRTLCLASLGARSVRGPRSAYAYAILTAINPVTLGPVNINRWTIPPSSHTGQVGIVIAGPSGTTDSNDLLGVQQSIEGLQNNPLTGARPDAVTVTTIAATPLNYSPTIQSTVIAPPGTNASDVQSAMATAVTNYLKTFPVGGLPVQDDLHPGGFQGLVLSGVYGAMAQGATSLAGVVFVSARGGTDLALTGSQVAVDDVTLGLPTLLPSQS